VIDDVNTTRMSYGFVIVTLMLIGCGPGKPSALDDLIGMNRVHVRAHRGDSTVVLTDPARLRALRTVLELQNSGWRRVWDTPPAGQLRAALFRDTVLLVSLGVGSSFLVVTDPNGQTYTLHATEGLLAAIRDLLNPAAPLPIKVIDVPRRDSAA
jgi:hypothetical protein